MPKINLKNSKIENIRHSLAHILASAVLQIFPKAKLGIGPTIENGFYYDFLLPRQLSENDLKQIENLMKELVLKNLEFKGKKVTYLEAKKLLKGQPFKLELIQDFKKEKKSLSIYETIDRKTKKVYFLDLCRGGHIKNTSEINPKAFKLVNTSGAYWRGSEKNPQLQRIYGIAFETEKELAEFLEKQELAKKCDHRNLADQLELFMIDEEIGRGLPLWLPNAYTTRRILEDYIYKMEKDAGYLHVLTPNIAKEDLYKKSGHLAHYRDDMYSPIEIEGSSYYLKPMNCPHHHSIYKYHKRSYKELPLRLAEFGTVYRYERSGVLSGLIRVRGFTQNDAHIYTDEKHLEEEILGVLLLHKKVYEDMKISDYWYRLSLPDFKNKEKYGDIKNKKMWENGAMALRRALNKIKAKYVEAIGEASFYGPKIDIQIKDIYGKEDTIATVQVDYYSAGRFNLNYIDENSKEKPVIIVHRAIFGSFDRFFAFLIEKNCGYLPLWLSPLQVKILPISDKFIKYSEKILKLLKENDIRAEIDNRSETLSKKIREAEIKHIPYILIIGEKEEKNNSISIRHPLGYKTKNREFIDTELNIENFLNKIQKEINDKK